MPSLRAASVTLGVFLFGLASISATACSKDAPAVASNSCDGLLRCCDSLAGPVGSQCRQSVEAARNHSEAEDSCKAALSTFEHAGKCGAASGDQDGGADANDPSRSPRAICEAYIACVGKTTPEGLAAVLAAYGPDGACWAAADEDLCLEACRTGVRGVRKVFPDEKACPECLSAPDCAGSPSGRACDTSAGRCVACTTDDACGGDTPACDLGAHACVECTSKAHCKGGACDPATHTCVACLSDSDCAAPNPRCKKGSGVANACVACRTGADCGTGACDDGKCCQPESCGQLKQLLGLNPATWVCGTIDSTQCFGAKIDCGACARGTCQPFGNARRCSLEDTPCTPGAAGACQNDELCAYVPNKSGYFCAHNLRGSTCVYGADSYKCNEYRFSCDGANMVQDGVCRSYCLTQADCAGGETCRSYAGLGYGICR